MRLKHTIKEYAKTIQLLKRRLSLSEKRKLAELWRDFQYCAVDPESRIMVSFSDDKTEWLTPDESQMFVHFLRGFGHAISATGELKGDIPPDILRLVYGLVKKQPITVG